MSSCPVLVFIAMTHKLSLKNSVQLKPDSDSSVALANS
nr:MAG TPA: hypothetical protein [Caudoviricetes sp.]